MWIYNLAKCQKKKRLQWKEQEEREYQGAIDVKGKWDKFLVTLIMKG